MQIVRDLAGYTMGRSDLVRRAMSKKKTYVMEAERKNFIYGNEAEGVTGCIANGIPESVANQIYDEMIDFAKYAFNKSHAACYAVVSYQTAYLKYYYPREFMAALMTSVLDNSGKVAEYILSCRQMGIPILPPDLNEGESGFSVSGNSIRYGLSAIKSVGRSVVDSIMEERSQRGRFTSMDDFVERMTGREINRRTLENFIKAGAMDTMPGNRRQKVMIVGDLIDQKNREKKNVLTGQMSLFDFAAEEEKSQYQIAMPKVEEYPKEELLAYEKEIMGVYVSGHPMDEYAGLWEKNVTAKTTDFLVDEETGRAVVNDGDFVTIGGIITDKIVKATRTGNMMAFLTVEDMLGSVEVLVFSRQFEERREAYQEGTKAFFQGQVSIGDDPVGKLRLNKMITFDELPRELWLQFADKAAFDAGQSQVLDLLRTSEGTDTVVIWLAKERGKKVLPANWRVKADSDLMGRLSLLLGEKNVRLVERGLKI